MRYLTAFLLMTVFTTITGCGQSGITDHPAPGMPPAKDIAEIRITYKTLEQKSLNKCKTFYVPDNMKAEFIQFFRGNITLKKSKKWVLFAEAHLTMELGPPMSLWMFFTNDKSQSAYQILYWQGKGKIETVICRGSTDMNWLNFIAKAEIAYEKEKLEETRELKSHKNRKK